MTVYYFYNSEEQKSWVLEISESDNAFSENEANGTTGRFVLPEGVDSEDLETSENWPKIVENWDNPNAFGYYSQELAGELQELAESRAEERSMAAAALGRRGGSRKSEAKTAAVRENGAKGGRPVKYFGIWGTKGARLYRGFGPFATEAEADQALRDHARHLESVGEICALVNDRRVVTATQAYKEGFRYATDEE